MKNKENEFEVHWEVEDGYAGGSRPHTFSIKQGSLHPDMTRSELSAMFQEMVQEEFEQRISWSSGDESAFIEWAEQRIEEMKQEP